MSLVCQQAIKIPISDKIIKDEIRMQPVMLHLCHQFITGPLHHHAPPLIAVHISWSDLQQGHYTVTVLTFLSPFKGGPMENAAGGKAEHLTKKDETKKKGNHSVIVLIEKTTNIFFL